MGLQLLFAIGLMSFSTAVALAQLMKRPPGWQGFTAVNIIVLITGAVALRWLPEWSGLAVAGISVPFVLAPRVLFAAARSQGIRGRMRAATIYEQLACRLHPTPRLRFRAAVSAAMAHRPIERKVEALRALAQRATPQQRVRLEAGIAIVQADWNAVLDCIQKADEELRRESKAWEIRALGEIGRLNDMVQAFSKEKIGPVGSDSYLCCLFVLSFAGRLDSVRLLLGKMPWLHSKDYWLAIAAKASGRNDEEPRRVMAAFASTTKNESLRRTAERHLAATLDPGVPALSPESTATIDAIEKHLPEQFRRRMRPAAPVTMMLVVLVVFGFVAEVSHGGTESPSTLIALGAVSAPLIRHGEWWRLATSWFPSRRPVSLLAHALLVAPLGNDV